MPNDNSFLADNISYLAGQQGLSLIALAEKISVDPSTLYRLADPANARQPRAKTLRVIADYFGVDPFSLTGKDLTTGAIHARAPVKQSNLFAPESSRKQNSYTGSLPLLRILNAELFSVKELHESLSAYSTYAPKRSFEVVREIPAPYGTDPERAFATEMVGDAMAPEIQNGDTLIVTELHDFPSQEDLHTAVYGRYVFVKMRLDTRTVVSVRKAIKNDFGELLVVSTNPDLLPLHTVVVELLGVVTGVYRALD